ncbi:Uncharacterised protein [Burkholderia pseudomallei]|nr:Uncharacterised protein [Burkholderia pseudomallei]CAJ8946608.1 Uncharacterised protein [Burkholderia pseudomallei]CAJ8985303.1 Uncharacterised protein [Burkholderia pseudomallei]CAJ9723772.1 Uncharacterised protein [Burkholderia pseudomallei]CAJ9738386.1 Uncharacterised protein [Burkholderia pseudomallei]
MQRAACARSQRRGGRRGEIADRDLDVGDADRRRAGDPSHAAVRMALPRVEPQRDLRAEMGALHRDRDRDLDGAVADHPVPRHPHVEDHARARSVPAARIGGEADRRRSRRARLEVALRLSGSRHCFGKPTGGARRHADQFPDHVRFGDELVLHPAARHAGLCDGRHADAPAPDRRRAGRLRRHLRELQRPRLLGHEVPHARDLARRVRRVGREGARVGRPARHDRVRPARAAEREAAGALLLDGRSSALQ